MNIIKEAVTCALMLTALLARADWVEFHVVKNQNSDNRVYEFPNGAFNGYPIAASKRANWGQAAANGRNLNDAQPWQGYLWGDTPYMLEVSTANNYTIRTFTGFTQIPGSYLNGVNVVAAQTIPGSDGRCSDASNGCVIVDFYYCAHPADCANPLRQIITPLYNCSSGDTWESGSNFCYGAAEHARPASFSIQVRHGENQGEASKNGVDRGHYLSRFVGMGGRYPGASDPYTDGYYTNLTTAPLSTLYYGANSTGEEIQAYSVNTDDYFQMYSFGGFRGFPGYMLAGANLVFAKTVGYRAANSTCNAQEGCVLVTFASCAASETVLNCTTLREMYYPANERCGIQDQRTSIGSCTPVAEAARRRIAFEWYTPMGGTSGDYNLYEFPVDRNFQTPSGTPGKRISRDYPATTNLACNQYEAASTYNVSTILNHRAINGGAGPSTLTKQYRSIHTGWLKGGITWVKHAGYTPAWLNGCNYSDGCVGFSYRAPTATSCDEVHFEYVPNSALEWGNSW